MKKVYYMAIAFYFVAFFFSRTCFSLPAFPGAEGFGSDTKGGRGGRVLEVTNLNTSGPNSFHAACTAPFPRIIVFRVAGRIPLEQNIWIEHPFVTIAGQTAPGDGICLGGTGGLFIKTHDVIVRGLRIRVDDSPGGYEPGNRDCIAVAHESETLYNVIIDHCSLSWGIDENISLWYRCRDITISWCITCEGLYHSIHPLVKHSKGMIIGQPAKNISIHHNIFAHNDERNPLLGQGTTAEVINNVVYNWRAGAITLGNGYTPEVQRCDVIGNYCKAGKDQGRGLKGIEIHRTWIGDTKIYLKGNVGPGRPSDSGDEWNAADNRAGASVKSNKTCAGPSGIATQSAMDAYKLVLDSAGAIVPRRDAVDKRIVADVRNGTGRIINSPRDVGGWPTYAKGQAPTDTDHDGMPDSWETAHGLNPKDRSDANGTDLSPEGYTNVEIYINGLIGGHTASPPAWRRPQLPAGSRSIAPRPQ